MYFSFCFVICYIFCFYKLLLENITCKLEMPKVHTLFTWQPDGVTEGVVWDLRRKNGEGTVAWLFLPTRGGSYMP